MFDCKTTIMFDAYDIFNFRFTIPDCTTYPIAIVIVFLLSILYEFILHKRCQKVIEITERNHRYY